jgi:alanine racemase
MRVDKIISKRSAWAEINLSNLSDNIKTIRSNLASKNIKVMAVVKADAYGHGAIEVSKQAVKSGAYSLGVALAEEGIELRKAGITVPIYVLGEGSRESMIEAIKNDLILGVNSYESAKFISKECVRSRKKSGISINIDTGMNRIGINFRNAPEEILKISGLPGLTLEGVSTHYACACSRGDSYTQLQYKRFSEVIEKIKSYRIPVKFYHCSNSAALFRYKKMNLDMIRAGIAIYGLNPYDMDYDEWLEPEAVKLISDLKPVLGLKAKISFIKKVPEGSPISYCGTFKTMRDSIIATLPVGYADGYSRLLSNKSSVLINGKFAPAVGNITMDQFMIDVTDIGQDINVGEEVTIIGDSGERKIKADDVAKLMGTINYEVVCMLKSRIPRIYVR